MTNLGSILKSRDIIANKDPSSQSCGFSSIHVCKWELDYKESWVVKNWCFWTVVLQKTLKSPLDSKEIQPVHPKGNESWIFIGRWSWNSNTVATWCEELTHLKRPWCWERLQAGGEGDDRGWDGWMPSRTQWTWVWVNSGSWWLTGRPGVLRFMESQRVGHDWATDLSIYLSILELLLPHPIGFVMDLSCVFIFICTYASFWFPLWFLQWSTSYSVAGC